MGELGVFDIIGPRMVGPSSSHTAGANRLGRAARRISGENIIEAKIFLHGSFAKTLKGHGTDKAIVAGLLGIKEDDPNLKHSFEISKDRNFLYEFFEMDLGDVHPNTVKFIITNSDGVITEIVGSSIGGGRILITEIDKLKIKFTGLYTALIIRHVDNLGIVAKVTKIFADGGINIAFMSVFRNQKGEDAFMIIEIDGSFSKGFKEEVKNTIMGIRDAFIIDAF